MSKSVEGVYRDGVVELLERLCSRGASAGHELIALYCDKY